MDIVTKRADFDRLGNLYEPHANVAVENVNINGINCYWFIPEAIQSSTLSVYLHGGGYMKGGLTSHRNMLTHFAAKLNTRILLIDYRLAPEHPYPAGLEDVVAVYAQLKKDLPNEDLFLMGDSAGGGLAIAAIKEMTAKNLSLPQAVVLISPWVYLEATASSYFDNRDKDPILDQQAINEYAALYIGDKPIVEASPGTGGVKAFPPVLILVGAGEILLDDSRHFFAAVNEVQPNAFLSVHNDVAHVWLLPDIHSPHATHALNEIKSFQDLWRKGY